MDFVEQIMNAVVNLAPKLLGAVVTFVVGFIIIGWINKAFRRVLENRGIDETVRPFFSSLVNIGLKVLLLLSAAAMFGIETTSFIAIFSALAFAIGLALQGTLGHFASGVLILMFRPYQVGDFIQAQGFSGTVKEVQIFTTVLQALDQRLISIPNGQVLSGAIENFTVTGIRKHDLTIGIGYDDDIDKAKSVIERVVKETPGVELDQGYDIFLKELGDSSVNFAVRFTCKNDDFWPAFQYFMEHIKKAFDAEGIGIPYPQMDVHLMQNN